MVREFEQEDKPVFQCTECGFIYENEQIAEKCEEYCSAHGKPNPDITNNSLKQPF